jgi:hypothetical protein
MEGAYSDDDLETLAAHLRERIDALKTGTTWDKERRVVDRAPELAETERNLAAVLKWQRKGIPAGRQEVIAKHAYRVRAQNEIITLQMVEGDRAKVRAGYGATVHFREHQIGPDATFDPAHIDWDSTIRHSSAARRGAERALHPGGRVRAGRRQDRTLRPRDYDSAWQRQRIDDYLLTWARLKGERLCLHCLAPLPSDAKDSRPFCNDRCRNAEKMKRHPRENPRAVERAQEKYWKT